MGTLAPTEDVAAALRLAAAGGPFFAVHVGVPIPPPAGDPPWRPLAALLDDADVLAARTAAVRAAAAARAGLPPDGIELRVAASLVHLGLVARLASPVLGAAVLGGVVPDLSRAVWRDVVGGPVPLALPGSRRSDPPAGYEGPIGPEGPERPVGPAGLSGLAGIAAGNPLDPDELAALLAPALLAGPAGRLTEAVGAYARLSPKVLWGNVASALGGAVRMLRSAAPSRAGLALGVWERLLSVPPLRGTGTLTLVAAPGADGADPDDAPPPGWSFTRSNCCLFYRVPGGGTCGDCVLNLRRARR